MNKKKSPLPLPQRYIDKKDIATLKAIEIIGREKYAELLDNNLIIQDYNISQSNRNLHREHIKKLNETISLLTILPIQKVHQHQSINPNHQSLLHNGKQNQQHLPLTHTNPIYPLSQITLLSIVHNHCSEGG